MIYLQYACMCAAVYCQIVQATLVLAQSGSSPQSLGEAVVELPFEASAIVAGGAGKLLAISNRDQAVAVVDVAGQRATEPLRAGGAPTSIAAGPGESPGDFVIVAKVGDKEHRLVTLDASGDNLRWLEGERDPWRLDIPIGFTEPLVRYVFAEAQPNLSKSESRPSPAILISEGAVPEQSTAIGLNLYLLAYGDGWIERGDFNGIEENLSQLLNVGSGPILLGLQSVDDILTRAKLFDVETGLPVNSVLVEHLVHADRGSLSVFVPMAASGGTGSAVFVNGGDPFITVLATQADGYSPLLMPPLQVSLETIPVVKDGSKRLRVASDRDLGTIVIGAEGDPRPAFSAAFVAASVRARC